ncbi:F420-dependent oxidoreductase [Nocardioides sp. MAH-18]|uniref:F420-dependent oxidoreductase n=1 Tax=Nocardioides agri TaxID=2682843 RepID=A0A6L6XUX0_9ACTN|nr:coenzyme F420-0:L-glutamate ligase [Nocardioides sp. CGMCC 1.13656]MBA2956341.1 coenzyme F420-0:L-glutamate ligase [Nocardioides sp. CGMCC 1.13656]MVQ51184.1 F420-dependent oxidoreductase [Nocardioides sp. MAH-18]
MTRLEVEAPDGVPEIGRGDDLATLLLDVTTPADGDVVVVTSKAVSKAEGRMRRGDREDAIAAETVRVVARRGQTSIVRNHLGLTMAAAGVDNSNVPLGNVVLLPVDPDASARVLREQLLRRVGANVAVIVSDTAGRAWREGQTDIAIGAAGLVVAEQYAGRLDAHGNELAVTLPAVADELAGTAELATGKLGGRPFTVIRGRADLVLPPGEHGPGAAALIRPEDGDLFGFGAREAVVRALKGDPSDRRSFGAPGTAAELTAAIRDVIGLHASPTGVGGAGLAVTHPRGLARALGALAFAHGWTVHQTDNPSEVRLRPDHSS